MKFIDREGLGPWADILSLDGEVVKDRLGLLAQLREGAGVTIVTGPRGCDFWSIVSPEVTVRVEPDGYDYEERIDEVLWSYLVAGADLEGARALVKREKPPVRGKNVTIWTSAATTRATLNTYSQGPIVVGEYAPEVWDVEQGLATLAKQEVLALDWEWLPASGVPVGLAFAGRDWQAYVPLYANSRSLGRDGTALQMGFRDRIRSGRPTILHNARADLQTQYVGDPIELVGAPVDDTIVLAYLAGEPVLDLKTLTEKRLGRQVSRGVGKIAGEISVERAARYAAGQDARNTYDLWAGLVAEVAPQWSIYQELEKPLVPVIASMEKYGQPVDMAAVIEEYRDAVTIEQGTRASIRGNWGFDVAVDREARAWLKQVLGFDPGTLDQRALSMYPQGEVDLLLLHRRQRTLRRNFLGRLIRRWIEAGRPDDFRAFPRFNQAGSPDGRRAPRSGRLSSADPNLQNQPRSIRRIYCGPSGNLFWSFDYSGLELRIAAALSGDPDMLAVLRAGGDLHGLFQERLRVLTGRWFDRSEVVKPANFEQLYGGGAAKLREIVAKQRVFIDVETAEGIVEGHKRTFPRYHRWRDERIALARQLGYAETARGRRRGMRELWVADHDYRLHLERAAANHVIQGTAADIVKEAMLRVLPVLDRWQGHMSLQVHDELCGWVPEGVAVADFVAEMKAAMESVPLEGLRLVVEGGVGRNWAEVKA